MSFQPSLRWEAVNASAYWRNNSHLGDANSIRYNPNGVGAGLLPEADTSLGWRDEQTAYPNPDTFEAYQNMYADALALGTAVMPRVVEVVEQTPVTPKVPAYVPLPERILVGAAA